MLLQSASPTFHLRLDPQQIEGTAVQIEADAEKKFFWVWILVAAKLKYWHLLPFFCPQPNPALRPYGYKQEKGKNKKKLKIWATVNYNKKPKKEIICICLHNITTPAISIFSVSINSKSCMRQIFVRHHWHPAEHWKKNLPASWGMRRNWIHQVLEFSSS